MTNNSAFPSSLNGFDWGAAYAAWKRLKIKDTVSADRALFLPQALDAFRITIVSLHVPPHFVNHHSPRPPVRRGQFRRH